MTGAETMRIARAAMRFAMADKRRKDAARAIKAIVETGPHDEADQAAFDQDLANERAYLRSCAASCGGYRRGLMSACNKAIASGIYPGTVIRHIERAPLA